MDTETKSKITSFWQRIPVPVIIGVVLFLGLALLIAFINRG